MNEQDEHPEIEAMLRKAGEIWRSRQIHEPASVALLDRRRTSPIRRSLIRAAAGLALIGALGLVVLVAVPSVKPVGGGASFGSGSNSEAPTPSESAPTLADIAAARLAAIEAVNNDRANFGGTYIDADGALVIQYVGANRGRGAVELRLVPGVQVRWQQVDRSRADLDHMLVAISGQNLRDIYSISIDTIANQVTVTIGPGGSAAEVSALLGAEYGDGVRAQLQTDIPGGHVGRATATP